ncbi:HAD hydrolase-like protein [Gordonia desulfuricans]|uniref:HAD hydrolase-like protein n=1 Tax=Gordonia desulfuricans TaxID=89051 RepID=A0A7K3LKR4_9ACTN|nr:HAD hydrolase-like protein [Gordonia desulfuricans]NDK88859.1 HAD hydrolase-like protein [Gordonia desulfuricans]
MSSVVDVDAADEMMVLWDLDQTLLDSGGVDREVWLDVCAELTGTVPDPPEVIPGSTVRLLFSSLLRQAGMAEPAIAAACSRAIEREHELLGERRDRLMRRGRALPGAHAAIDHFARSGHITQSVLTGNQVGTARIKLDAYGLSSGLDLEQGAFGTHTVHRRDLVVDALELARARRGAPLRPGDLLMIGDAVFDVEAARSNGARVVAVATGVTPADELRAAGADLVIDDLVDLIPAMSSHPVLKGFL